METLIIVTRIHATPATTGNDLPDEFCKYWGGNGNTPFLEFQADDRKIKVINGPYFYSGLGAKSEWINGKAQPTKEEYSELIMKFFGNTGGEMGVIVHGGPVALVGYIMDHVTRLKFAKEYSSRNVGLYSDIYIPLAQSCTNMQIGRIDLFDVLWKHFAGDDYLEAALEILHACLTPEGRDSVCWDDNGQITIPRNSEGPFIGSVPTYSGIDGFKTLKEKNDGPFGEGYIGALTGLRDRLLKNYQ